MIHSIITEMMWCLFTTEGAKLDLHWYKTKGKEMINWNKALQNNKLQLEMKMSWSFCPLLSSDDLSWWLLCNITWMPTVDRAEIESRRKSQSLLFFGGMTMSLLKINGFKCTVDFFLYFYFEQKLFVMKWSSVKMIFRKNQLRFVHQKVSF